jgi:hypothetical protein
MSDDVYAIVGTGASITTSATSQSVAIPTDSSGGKARFVVISVTQAAYVRPGNSSVTATTTDIICNANEKTVLNVAGCTNIAALQQGSSGNVTIVPVTL